MPHYPGLIDFLVRAQLRVRADGTINLTHAEAQLLQGCDFADARAGAWQIPSIPDYVPVPAYLLRALPQVTRGTTTPAPVPPPAPVRQLFPPRPSPLPADDPMALAGRLRSWWLGAPVPHRRILRSILNTPDGRICRRRLRKNHRRLDVPTFRAALDALHTAALVTLEETAQHARWVVIPPAVRQAFAALGLGGGRQAQSPRALTSARQRRSRRRHERPQPARQHTGQHRRRRMPAPLTDRDVLAARRRARRRKPIPARGTPEWRRHMCALKGAYASHRACQARGIVQTSKATLVRLANQLRREQPGSAAHVTYRAPVTSSAIQAPGNTHSPVSAPSTTASALSSAYAYNQPLGRRERLAEERNRR